MHGTVNLLGEATLIVYIVLSDGISVVTWSIRSLIITTGGIMLTIYLKSLFHPRLNI